MGQGEVSRCRRLQRVGTFDHFDSPSKEKQARYYQTKYEESSLLLDGFTQSILCTNSKGNCSKVLVREEKKGVVINATTPNYTTLFFTKGK
jgi:hypothetical protein